MDADILLQQLEDLKWQLSAYQKKCAQYAEEVTELRGDLHNSLNENQILTEKLRLGIKRGDVYIRDSQGSILLVVVRYWRLMHCVCLPLSK